MIPSARADREIIFVLSKDFFRRHTLCMARKKDAGRAKIGREMPPPNGSAISLMRKTEHLIKSGGGNGPVKPGNLCFQKAKGAKSGGETKDEALCKHFMASRRKAGRRFSFS